MPQHAAQTSGVVWIKLIYRPQARHRHMTRPR